MGWDRSIPPEVEAPPSVATGRWLLGAGAAVLIGVLLFMLHAAERVPLLQLLNIWVLAIAPLLLWAMLLIVRLQVHGSAVNYQLFLQQESDAANASWQEWAHRSLVVNASCLLLPDQVTATALMQGDAHLPLRDGLARRVSALPAGTGRAEAGLLMLMTAMTSALDALPSEHTLRVTLLCDAPPCDRDALLDAWHRAWATRIGKPQPATVMLTEALSFEWMDEVFRTGSSAFELLLVVQVNGAATYSDGLAALLFVPDKIASAFDVPVRAALLRPMPLEVSQLEDDVHLFLRTQASARLACGLLADNADWQPVINGIRITADTEGVLRQQWIQERLCGLAGPFNQWLTAALAAEVVQHKAEPLLLLTREKSRHWINTVMRGC